MQEASHRRRELLVALIVAALALAAIGYAWPILRGSSGPDPIQAAWERREQLRAAAEARTVATAPVPTTAPAPAPATPLMRPRVPAEACRFAPALTSSSAADGLFSPRSAMEIAQPGGAQPFLDVAREAVVQRRERDAESAFIVACRLQARAADDPLRLADIQAELAGHYIDVARRSAPGAERDAVIARAKHLLDDAMQGHGTSAGAGKASQLRADLAALDAAGLGAAGDASPDPSLALGLPGRGAELDTGAAAHAVAAARLVAQDPELAQLDSDLQRLRAQAQTVTRHPSEFRRRAEAARARRDACGDRDCLLRWYAARRSELIEEF